MYQHIPDYGHTKIEVVLKPNETESIKTASGDDKLFTNRTSATVKLVISGKGSQWNTFTITEIALNLVH